MEARMDEFEQKTVDLDAKMDEILNSGAHLVYLDECVFK